MPQDSMPQSQVLGQVELPNKSDPATQSKSNVESQVLTWWQLVDARWASVLPDFRLLAVYYFGTPSVRANKNKISTIIDVKVYLCTIVHTHATARLANGPLDLSQPGTLLSPCGRCLDACWTDCSTFLTS